MKPSDEDLCRRLKKGGDDRYGALKDFLKKPENYDHEAVLVDLADCVLDLNLGTYLRAYEVFQVLVKQDCEIEKALTQLVIRAQDSYRSGQQLRWTLLRYAEKTTDNARKVWAEVGRQNIPRGEQAPVWVLELKDLLSKSVVAQTLRWKERYGVTISSGDLSWFTDDSSGYSQGYRDFLKNGPKGLWIDRSMPEETRVQIYEILGASAPKVKLIPEKLEEVTRVFSTWARSRGTGDPECASCAAIPDGTSETTGGKDDEEHVNNLPAVRVTFLKILRFESGLVEGCPHCGRLYLHVFEHFHDVFEPNEDTESLRKYSFQEICDLVLEHVAENEDYEVFQLY